MKSISSLLTGLLLFTSGSIALPHEPDHGHPSYGNPGHGDHHGKADPLTVKTRSGTVTGFINSTAPNVRQWLGIPYAEPPVGRLRYMPPKPNKKFGHLNAKTYKPSCMQQLSNTPTVYTEQMPQFLINGGDSEDCLYINIYAPLKPVEKKLPVFIYIPGGGFTSGGSDSLYKIPDKWIERSQTHIVVIMNYRVNVFGFPSSEAQPLNAGLLDQRLVVEYVRDNIAAFGGDASRITLWGQSAGAASASIYSYAYPKDPIIKGFIADSGAAGVAQGTNTGQFSKFAEAFGCGDAKNAKKELECMQKVDAKKIQQTLSFGGTGARFTPSADGKTAFANYTERLEKGLVAKIPAITGSNSNEGAGFGGYDPNGMLPGQYQFGLNAIVCPVANEVSRREKYGYTTYRYFYSGNFSNISPLPWIGATHSAELPLLFGTHYEYRGNSTEFEWEVAGAMQSLWLSFARDASKAPREGKLQWKKYDSDQKTLLSIASGDVVAQFVSPSVVNKECAS